MCPRHSSTEILVSEPDHFSKLSPDGGCTLPCENRMSCGHACTGRCHSDVLHKTVKCLEPCQRLRPVCGHQCPQICGDTCGKKCLVRLNDLAITLDCGHKVSRAPCWQAQDPSTIRCEVKVKKLVPGCNHEVVVSCITDVTATTWDCKTACDSILPCGHACKEACFRCLTVEDGKVTTEDHGTCKKICGRNFTTCNHTCPALCHADSDCSPCPSPCDVRCSHSKCSRPCHEPCTPCAESVCASKCPHGACTMPYVPSNLEKHVPANRISAALPPVTGYRALSVV